MTAATYATDKGCQFYHRHFKPTARFVVFSSEWADGHLYACADCARGFSNDRYEVRTIRHLNQTEGSR